MSICAPARSIPPRPLAPRRGCAGDGEAVGVRSARRAANASGGRHDALELRSARSSALAYPDRVAKNRGGGGALSAGQWPRRQCRSGIGAGARAVSRRSPNLTGAAAPSRIVLAAPITLDEIESAFRRQDRGPRRGDLRRRSASLRARRSRRLGAMVLAEQIKQVTPDAETARILAQGIVGSASTVSPGARRRCNCATACSSCAARKATNGRTVR